MVDPSHNPLRLIGHGLASERETVRFTFDDAPVTALAGESVAAALLADGPRALRRTRFRGAPRTFFCGMGVCHDCLVTIDGRENMRACMSVVREGMVVRSGGAM